MKKKINRCFVGIAVFSILLTLLVMTAVFYFRLKAQVFSDLKVIAKLLLHDESPDSGYGALPDDIRVTWIAADGTVYYDTAVSSIGLENHLDRPEVKEALETGTGQGVRKSDTLSMSVFYYAVRLDDGRVLRVGKESESVIWLFLSAIPIVSVTVLVLVVVCMIASHYLTFAIVAPIDSMAENMERMDEQDIYEELLPFARKIRSQHEEILSSANMRQEFTANVTHELKTPLAAISGYAELMESGIAKEEDIRHFSYEIGRSASRLLTLINDIMKLSRLDAGGYEEALEIVDFAQVARDTVEMLSINASKMNVSISYEGCEHAGIRIGKELAEELTYNLIENAIRYNRPNGTVDVSVALEAETVSFTVSDTGMGIPQEHQARVFERFYRVDKSRSKELGGTGLGLAIVKHICSLTGGKLVLASREGEGTTVTITWDDICEDEISGQGT